MTNVTYKIKTHNPIVIFLVTASTILLSIWLLSSYRNQVVIVIEVVISFSVLAFCNYFLGNNIEVQLTENGIATTWAELPFFSKSYKEILWTDIVDWNFTSQKTADTFYIKTKENGKLYIRCFNLVKRQENLDNFLKTFREYYSQNKIAGKKISN